jgi:RNA polymerase sigma factor (sigma-70 family)
VAELAVEAGDLDGRDDELVVEVVGRHAGALLRTARRYSLCADDAADAYQRALEIFLTRAGRLRRETAVNWLHQVVKHEALAVREQRQRLVATEQVEPDGTHAPTPEDRVVSLDRTQRAAEALARLKPQEVQALWLKAQGLSYQEIAARQSWTYTKVNRCLTEGRKAFLERYAGIEAGEECRRWAPVVSALVDGEATAREVREVRTHLRHCAGCRSTVRELRASGPSLAGVLPAGAAAPAALESMPEPGGLLARVYEALAGGVHERAVGSAVKLQAAAEAAATGKVAAVAASAAAIATGGAVTAERSGVLDERPAAQQARAERAAAAGSAAAQAPSPPVVVRSEPAAAGRVRQTRRSGGVTPAARRRARRAAPAREFGFEDGGGTSSPSAAPRAPTASAAGGASRPASPAPPKPASNASPEFGFEAAP